MRNFLGRLNKSDWGSIGIIIILDEFISRYLCVCSGIILLIKIYLEFMESDLLAGELFSDVYNNIYFSELCVLDLDEYESRWRVKFETTK